MRSLSDISKYGKVNWNRTIKTQKPVIQDSKAFYLDLVIKKNQVNEKELITLIHKFCVYDSFEKIGWLFTDKRPLKPGIKYNVKLFKRVVKNKLLQTFNDRNKKLFLDMMAILNYESNNDLNKDFKFGTYRFEYVWEKLVDNVFGIKNKEFYFPGTSWKLDKLYKNACLEPDSIMCMENTIYVLDSKYYKFGVTGNPRHLPGSVSVNKQITYGEFIATDSKFDKIHGKNRIVYNAFIMPFDAMNSLWGKSDLIISAGEAVSDWKNGDKEYERIQGILIDVKFLMQLNTRLYKNEIFRMAEIITGSAKKRSEN